MDKTQVLIPQNLTELAEALAQATPKSKIVAGGTDLIISLQAAKHHPDFIIDLSGVKELVYIHETPTNLRIGAMITFSALKDHPVVQQSFPALAEASSRVGSNQIRNRATIGGNVANASPAGDAIPVLAMLQAKVSVISSDGLLKDYSMDELLIGAGKTRLNYNEVIVGLTIPLPTAAFRGAYVKLGNRSAVTIAMINLAMGLTLAEETMTIQEARLVIGAVSPKAMRLPEIEKFLANRHLDEPLYHELAELLSRLIEKTAPLEFEMIYKKDAVKGVVLDLLQKLAPEVYDLRSGF